MLLKSSVLEWVCDGPINFALHQEGVDVIQPHYPKVFGGGVIPPHPGCLLTTFVRSSGGVIGPLNNSLTIWGKTVKMCGCHVRQILLRPDKQLPQLYTFSPPQFCSIQRWVLVIASLRDTWNSSLCCRLSANWVVKWTDKNTSSCAITSSNRLWIHASVTA